MELELLLFWPAVSHVVLIFFITECLSEGDVSSLYYLNFNLIDDITYDFLKIDCQNFIRFWFILQVRNFPKNYNTLTFLFLMLKESFPCHSNI